MESITPTPPVRNRRTGRATFAPEETTASAAPQPVNAAPAPVEAPPSAAVPASPPPSAQGLAPAHAPRYPQHTAAQSSVSRPAATVQVQPRYQPVQTVRPTASSAAYPARYPQAQAAPQPTARRTAQAAPSAVTRSTAPGARPRPNADPRALRTDDPDQRRAARQSFRANDEAETKPEKPARSILPHLLWGGVMALLVVLGALLLQMASLHHAMDALEQAKADSWQNIIYRYHFTQAEDGSLHVTHQALIEKYAVEYGLDPAFVTAVICKESDFRTKAESSVGARGLMQMMPATAQWIAGKLDEPYDFDKLYEAETAIRYGCWYLNFLSEIFGGDTVLVCAAYHAGQGEVLGWLGEKSISPDGVCVPIQNIPIPQTKQYAERVTTAYGIYEALLYPDAPQTPDVPGADGHAADGQLHAAR